MGSFFITLREGFEAALIVGLVLAYLKKTGNLERHAPAVWWGVAAGVAVSLIVGGTLFATVGELEGTAEMLYEGIAMLLAAGVVTWMVFWMRKQAATIGANLRHQVGESLLAAGEGSPSPPSPSSGWRERAWKPGSSCLPRPRTPVPCWRCRGRCSGSPPRSGSASSSIAGRCASTCASSSSSPACS